jgi:hypothetical protein
MQFASPLKTTPIDAVITWVDGSDPSHHQKRMAYMAPAVTPLHVNGTNPHRWACSDELSYCIRSIANHASWVRRIWIVTDAQTPDLSRLPLAVRDKITVVDHKVLFAGYEEVLPTFNSLAIESMMWRIPELAEHFIYFNDDVFLTAPLYPSDVFCGSDPVLRGKWVDYTALIGAARQSDPALFNHFTQINAAAMLGFSADHLFASAHVVHPARRSVFANLFETHREAFLQNISHRFRDVGQFLPQGLHNHACIRAQACSLHFEQDHLHLRSGAVEDYPIYEVEDYLKRALRPEYKFLCVNDLGQVEAAIPHTRRWIERAIGKHRIAA